MELPGWNEWWVWCSVDLWPFAPGTPLPTTLSQRIQKTLQMLGGHTCNPSYSGGRDQEELNSKPALRIV
jgi:hypothetical protein